MKQRCYNINYTYYKDYGGRGIAVCDEWLNDFQAFYEWSMNNGYKDNLTIDRIDNNKGYSPNNCRWVTRKTQVQNRRNNVYITYDGKTQTLSQWADELGVRYNTLVLRHIRGWKNVRDVLFGRSKNGKN